MNGSAVDKTTLVLVALVCSSHQMCHYYHIGDGDRKFRKYPCVKAPGGMIFITSLIKSIG
jgi:hypothetical protein